MSFRNRLTSFFLVIVLAPMLAVGVLVLRLISDSGQAKAEARVSGLLTTAASVYRYDEVTATGDAAAVAHAAASIPPAQLTARLRLVAAQTGLVRVLLVRNGRTIVNLGTPDAVAPGVAYLSRNGVKTQITVSTTTGADLARSLTGPGAQFVISQGGQTLASSIPRLRTIPKPGNVTVAGTRYRGARETLPGLGARAVEITALSDLRATSSSLSSSRVLASVFLVGFLILAFSFAVLASRGLENQVSRFLRAARRLAGGDFSAPVPVEGNDAFAMLAAEFNTMSQQLAQRLDQLRAERERLRESIRRVGETFASNLDRQGLLSLALNTAVDAAEADCGRLSVRSTADGPLWETARENDLEGFEQLLLEAEREALKTRSLAECETDREYVMSVPLGPFTASGRPLGLVTVARRDRPFTDDDKDLFRSLVGQATLALDNIELHQEVQRQAVTDELTGLANHGRFQEVLGSEMDQVRRYHYPVGLIMVDLDNFKQVNDTYGHPQGDLVLKQVAQVLRDTSREADSAARYGGEEMALILPHTDLEGSYAIAERVRTAIEELRVPLLDGGGILPVTASLGVGATTDGGKETLIAETDAALYRAKRQGKNRTIRATATTANVAGAE